MQFYNRKQFNMKLLTWTNGDGITTLIYTVTMPPTYFIKKQRNLMAYNGPHLLKFNHEILVLTSLNLV
jgi:hypothetical protein